MRVVVGTYELVVRSVYSFVQEEGFTTTFILLRDLSKHSNLNT